MSLVVLDQCLALLLTWAGEPKTHRDALEHRRIASMPNGFQVHLDLVELDAGLPGTALNQKNTARCHPGHEGVGRRDLYARTAKVGRLVNDELVVANLIDGAARRGRTR